MKPGTQKGAAKTIYRWMADRPSRTFTIAQIAQGTGLPETNVGNALASSVISSMWASRYRGLQRVAHGVYMVDPLATSPQRHPDAPSLLAPPAPEACPEQMIVCRIGTATDGVPLFKDDDSGRIYRVEAL